MGKYPSLVWGYLFFSSFLVDGLPAGPYAPVPAYAGPYASAPAYAPVPYGAPQFAPPPGPYPQPSPFAPSPHYAAAPQFATVEDNFAIVERSAGYLNNEVVEDDPVVVLQVVQDHSIYRHDITVRHGSPIFVRKGNDEGKSVVVLREGEDFLPKCGTKKTFVVLKQTKDNKNHYKIFYAYVRSSHPTPSVEFDVWFPRGNARNKATSFGFINCISMMLPCKKDEQFILDDSSDYEDFSDGNGTVYSNIMPKLPYVHPPQRVIQDAGSDYWCDLLDTTLSEKRFIGTVTNALVQAMTVLTGAELFYRDEAELIKQVQLAVRNISDQILTKGRALVNPTVQKNTSDAVAEKIVEIGRSTVAGGTLYFYASVVKLGALALNETPPHDNLVPGAIKEAELNKISLGYKAVGMNILRSLFRGVDFEDPDQHPGSHHPHLLLNEYVVASLVAGKTVAEAISNAAATGRGILGWLTGKADVGTSSSNGEQVMRQYKGIQRDGSVTGSKAIDNLNFAIDNAFGGTKKSAGQIFSENIIAGAYTPWGLLEDVADGLSGSILGIGKVSSDRTYLDDLVDKALTVVGGAGGQIVDVVGDILGPIGLGGLWNGVAGVAGAALGGIGTGLLIGFPLTAPFVAGYQLIKIGAKALGIGGVIGMQGDTARQANEGGNQNTNHYSAPQAGAASLPQHGAAYIPPSQQQYAPQNQLYANARDVPTAYPGGGPTTTGMFGRRKRDAASEFMFQHLDVEGRTDVDIFSHMGWITAEIPQDKLSIANFSHTAPFVGFGNCNLKPVTAADFTAVTTAREAAKLYMQTLRTHCLKDQYERFKDALDNGYLKFDAANKNFYIPDGLHALTKIKLSSEEVKLLQTAFEMSTYTQTYQAGLKKKESSGWFSFSFLYGSSPEGTRNVATFKAMVLKYLEDVNKKAPWHFIKLTRMVGKLVKTAFTKSLQDFNRYKYCRKCKEDQMKQSMHDCVLLAALLDFIAKFQEEQKYHALSKEKGFELYYADAGENITKRMGFYFI